MKKQINNDQAKQAHGILAGLLEKIGLGSKWAKIIAAAILAGLLAALGFTVSGCSGTRVIYTHPAYGSIIIHNSDK